VGGDFDDFAEETGEWKASSRVSDGNIVLLVLAPGGIRSFELARGGLSTLGRAPTSELFVDHPSVSRAHAQISVDPEGGVRLRDLGSRNGTRVNGQPTGDATILLHVGDQIAFGDVNAQLQMVRRLPTARLAQWLQPDDFDRALVVEAERALRFALSLGFVRIDVVVPPNRADDLRALITRALRLIDVVTPRAPGRFDLMMPGCDKESAIGLAKRIHELLRALGTSARLGVAAYPGDAP